MITLDTNKQDVLLKYFLRNPTEEVHLRQLSRKVSVAFPWVRKMVLGLVKKGILVQKKEHGLVLVKSNGENELFRALKRSYNLFSILSSGIVSFLIDNYSHPEAVVLFGSYCRGEDSETSDIDIAVVTKRHIVTDVSIFEKSLLKKIKILELDSTRIQSEFLNTLANGIVLYGYLEVK